MIAGRTVAELVELSAGLVVVALCGLIVGWAPHGTVLETAAAFGLLLVMAFAFTWIGVWVGLMVRDPDGADGIVMSVIFPLMFLSGIFVPVAGLPDGLQQIATYNPVTALATARPRAVSQPDRQPARRLGPAAPGDHVAAVGGRADGGVRAAGDPPLQAARLLSAREIEAELGRVTEIDVLRRAIHVGMDQHADHLRQRARDRDLAGAQQRHRSTAPSRVPRRPGTRRRGPA